jgi:hypothetical protein
LKAGASWEQRQVKISNLEQSNSELTAASIMPSGKVVVDAAEYDQYKEAYLRAGAPKPGELPSDLAQKLAVDYMSDPSVWRVASPDELERHIAELL